MFKDTKDGQTHYENDGCGELEHNSMSLKTNNEWEKRLRSILDNYMPNEGIRNLVIREYKEALSSECRRVREETESELMKIQVIVIEERARISERQRMVEEIEKRIKTFKPWKIQEDEFARGKKNGTIDTLYEILKIIDQKTL